VRAELPAVQGDQYHRGDERVADPIRFLRRELANSSVELATFVRIVYRRDPPNLVEHVATHVQRSGGSLPAGFVVHATECWDATFARVFYTEDVDATKNEGSLSACALP